MSEFTAARTLRRFFAPFPHAQFVTPEEIYAATGRTDLPARRNYHWLSNRLTSLKRYGMIKTEYHPDKRLARIVLTPKGKSALIKGSQEADIRVEKRSFMSLEYAWACLKQWEEDNPSFRATLTISKKEDREE